MKRVTAEVIRARFIVAQEVKMCTCGHLADTHKHYTHGRYCGSCGCERYRPWYPWRRYRPAHRKPD